jgi:hypothetical protein
VMMLCASGCVEVVTTTSYGDGTVTILVEPLEGDGLTIKAEVPGATLEQLTSAESSCAPRLDHEESSRDGLYAESLYFCAEDIPVEGSPCYDEAEVSFWAWEGEHPPDPRLSLAAGGGPPRVSQVEYRPWSTFFLGGWGGFMMLEPPCGEGEPVEHMVELFWHFEEAHIEKRVR